MGSLNSRPRSERRDPCTRQQTAAHEAGHVVVACTFGARFKSAQIVAVQHPRGTAWVGNTQTELPGRDPALRTSAAEDPLYALRSIVNALRSIVNALAGICGEICADVDHPASSTDERFFAARACLDLARVIGVPAPSILAAAVSLCRTALVTNSGAFEVVRTRLAFQERVTGLKLRPVLSRAARLDFEEAAAQALLGDSGEAALPARFAALVSGSVLTLEPYKT